MVQTSIIILTKNAGREFEKTLKMVFNQKHDDFEVLIIDSGSTDNTLDIAREFETKIYEIKPEEFHHSKTRNLGAELSIGDYLVYLSQDATPVNDEWLKNLIAPLKNEESDIVYGKQVAYGNAKPMDKFFYDYFYPTEKIVLTKRNINNPKTFYLENIFLSYVTAAIKRECWSEIRFNENIFHSEDKNFSLRALKNGYKIVYEPKVLVYHSHEYSIVSLFRRRFNDGVGFSMITLSSNNNKLIENRDDFIIRGLRYWWKETHFLIKNGYIKWIPYAILYDIIYLVAFELGKRAKLFSSVGKGKILKRKRKGENEKA